MESWEGLAGLEPWQWAAVGLVFLVAVAALATIASQLGGLVGTLVARLTVCLSRYGRVSR